MEAHYAKLSILAIVILVALMNVPSFTGNATYTVEDTAKLTLSNRLCPNGLTPISYQQIGVNGPSTIVVSCVKGRSVMQIGARFDTRNRAERFELYDRFTAPRQNSRGMANG